MKIKFAILQSAYWCMYAGSYVFMVAYLLENGIEVSVTGYAMAAATLAGFFGQFFIGALCDKLQRSKSVYAVGMIYVLVILALIMVGDKTPLFVIVMMALFGFGLMPMSSILDAWILKSFDDQSAYGPIRSWGSIAFAVFSLGYGVILDSVGFDAMMIFSILFVTINTVVVMIVPDVTRTHSAVHLSDINKMVFTNKRFLTYLGLMFFYGFAIQPMTQLVAVVITDVGGSITDQGISSFFSAGIQMPVLLLAPKLAHISAKKQVVVSMLCFVICLIILSLSTTPTQVIIARTINGIGYAIALSSMRNVSMSMCPKEMRTTAVSLVDAFHVSLAGCLGAAISGVIMQSYGMQFFMAIASGIMIVTTVVTIVFFRKKETYN